MRMMAAILAGGRARRLGGVAKGLVCVGGQAIVARQLRVLMPLVEACAIVAGEPDAYAPIASQFGARLIRDREPGRGPLAGLDAALAHLEGETLLLIGCDFPFVDDALITTLRDGEPQATALVPRVDGRAQPLLARYSRSIAPVVQSQLRHDQLRMLDLLPVIDARYLELPPTRALMNVNTPEELAQANAIAATEK